MPGRHHRPGLAGSLAVLLGLLLGLAGLNFAAGCALVYVAGAPDLQQVGNPSCVLACDSTTSAATSASSPEPDRRRRGEAPK